MKTADSKVISYDAIMANVQTALEKLKRPLVFTNGCFDIIHRGHVSYLQSARSLGSSLVVGVNSDASVRRQNKGNDRPINSLEDRMAILVAFECVDAVIPFDEDTPENLIHAVKPNHLVKGGDWKTADIIGGDFVSQYGGEVHSITFEYDRSTTMLLEKIRSL